MSHRSCYNSMSFRLLRLIALLLVVCLQNVLTSDWTYKDQEQWTHRSKQCAGSSQSPIDIEFPILVINSSLHLEFSNYDRPLLSFNVFNNYHSIQYSYIGDRGSAPSVSGSALNNEKFILDHFHFHWGQSRGKGSEHSLNGSTYSMEMHLVHYNRKYKSLTEALGKRYGVAVVGVFVEIEKEDNPNFNVIQKMASEVANRDKSVRVNPEEPITLSEVLPQTKEEFFRYQGSLTTPPCTEPVEWTLLAHPIRVGTNQVNVFRHAANKDTGELIVDNFRKIQNLNERMIQSSFKPESPHHDDNDDDHHKDDNNHSGTGHQTTDSLASLTVLMVSSIVIGHLYR